MTQINAVVFDWAGTMVDFGSCAPMGVFVEVFKQFGVDITIDEARGPMGRPKWDHIKEVGSLPRVAAAWEAAHGSPFSDVDVDRIYEAFVPRNIEVASRYADLIPGAAEIVNQLRAEGIKIGSTTGYTRNIMEEIIPVAAEQGYAPDSIVCFGDTPEGRPSPLMMYKVMLDLGVWPANSVVKVDDTPVGIREGIEAGTWTVGVAISGNMVGLTKAEWDALSLAEQAERRAAAAASLKEAGAHFVVDSVADLMPVLLQLQREKGAP